jgi:tetratricopeptide (TPR) repeat protein
MSRTLLGRSVSVFVLIGVGCVSAQLLDWQEQYFAGMRALQEGRYADAHTSLHAAYDRARAASADDEWMARTSFGLASLARTQGDCGMAERLQRAAITLLEGRGEPSPLLAMAWNGLGEALLEQARIDEAEPLVTKALRVFESDSRTKEGAFLCRRHLAEIRFMHEDYAGAETLLKALIADERREPAAADLVSALGVLGRTYMIQHRWTESELLLREAMERDLPLGEQSPALADSRVTLATLYRVQGHIERAEPLLRKSIKTYQAIGDPHAAMAYAQLGWCALAERKYMTARDLLQKAVDVAAHASMSEALVSKLRDEVAAIGPSFAQATRSRR